MVNFPAWDPERLKAGGRDAVLYFEEMRRQDEQYRGSMAWLRRSPMLNRATCGRYAPGSTFKILTSIALLEEGVANSRSSYNESDSYYQGRGFRFRTSHPAGLVDLIRAIEVSSNSFFWHYSEQMPGGTSSKRYEQCLLPWALEFGFGTRPGLDLTSQTAGNLPEAQDVSAGELANLSIGQGRLMASPLQVARFMCAVATRGRLPTPHLSKEGSFEARDVGVSRETWNLVQEGMRRVVHGGSGTARRSSVCQSIKAAAKTGTAQNGKFRAPNGELLPVPDHAWFAGYAPHDKPRIAFAVLAEYSGLSGGDLADLTGEVVKYALEQQESNASAETVYSSVRK